MRKIRNPSLSLLIRLYKAKILPIFSYVAHVWSYKDYSSLEPAQAYFFKFMFGLEQSASATLLRLEVNIPSIQAYITNNLLKFWGRILCLDESRIPKILAHSLLH